MGIWYSQRGALDPPLNPQRTPQEGSSQHGGGFAPGPPFGPPLNPPLRKCKMPTRPTQLTVATRSVSTPIRTLPMGLLRSPRRRRATRVERIVNAAQGVLIKVPPIRVTYSPILAPSFLTHGLRYSGCATAVRRAQSVSYPWPRGPRRRGPA